MHKKIFRAACVIAMLSYGFLESVQGGPPEETNFDGITRGIKSGVSLVGSVYETFQGIAQKIRESSERRRFEAAIRGGHAIYLDEDKSSRTSVRPFVVPFHIDVTRAMFSSKDGQSETEHATRSAQKIFNNPQQLEGKVLVRKRTFARDDFGDVDDPAPGKKKVLDIWYRCLDDRFLPAAEDLHARAHEMNNIELSCKNIPSVYRGRFGS